MHVRPLSSVFEQYESMDRTTAQLQVNLSLLRSIFLKFQPLPVFRRGGGGGFGSECRHFSKDDVNVPASLILWCTLYKIN
jgi:hypothetical protein